MTIHATANMDIQEARIDLNCAGLQTLPMTINGTKATGQFTLALDPDGKAQYSSYQILFTGTNGHSIRRPVRYNVDVDRDLVPDVAIVEPQQQQEQQEPTLAENGQLTIKVHAFDPDFALRYVTLQAERGLRPEAKRKNWVCRCSWTAPSPTRPGRNRSTASISSGLPIGT